MGNLISHVVQLVRDFLGLVDYYKAVSRRLTIDPGLPVPNPSVSFWTVPPSPIAKHLSDLPVYADVVIIGSGITGASIARSLLGKSCKPVSVAMLEARDICSGATGRNGGHTNPILYPEYEGLKEKHGIEMAQKIIRFRASHFSEMKRVCEEEHIMEAAQCRNTENCEVFYNKDVFESAKKSRMIFEQEMPEEAAKYSYTVYESKDAIERFRLADDVVGCVATASGGAMHPYQLVTGVLSNILKRHPERFHLLANTPCTSISPPTSSTPFYTVVTPRGTVTTPHVIHATNAYASHLLPAFRDKVFPVRGTMTAQRPGVALAPSTLNGLRSYVFFRDAHSGDDYLTQLPSGENELMLGRGVLKDIGISDDSDYSRDFAMHLSGALPIYFGERNWGAEKPPTDLTWHQGRVKSIWSGIISISADSHPWVGRLPYKLSGRKSPPASSTPGIAESQSEASVDSKESIFPRPITAAPGEWICASYTGEGMVHAWLCAKAVASMVLGTEVEEQTSSWFPEVMAVTEARWKKAKMEDLMAMLRRD